MREGSEQTRQCDDQIIERRCRMRRCSGWVILEIVMANDGAGMLKTNPRARHSRIAISIDEINLPARENLGVIDAAGNENESAKNY